MNATEGFGEERTRRAARRMTNTHRATRRGDYLAEQSAEIMRIDSTCSFLAPSIDDEELELAAVPAVLPVVPDVVPVLP